MSRNLSEFFLFILLSICQAICTKKSLNYSTYKKSVSNGANNGFMMLLDAETFDYSIAREAAEGFSLSILHHLDVPIMKQVGCNRNTENTLSIFLSFEGDLQSDCINS